MLCLLFSEPKLGDASKSTRSCYMAASGKTVAENEIIKQMRLPDVEGLLFRDSPDSSPGNSHLSTDRRRTDAAREAALTRRFFGACTFHFGDDFSFQNVPNVSFGGRVTCGRRTSRRELSGRPGGLPTDHEDAQGLPGFAPASLPRTRGISASSTPARAAPCAEPKSQPASPGADTVRLE